MNKQTRAKVLDVAMIPRPSGPPLGRGPLFGGIGKVRPPRRVDSDALARAIMEIVRA